MTDNEIALLIGELKGTMLSVQSSMLNLHEEIKTISMDMKLLPCARHTQDIEKLITFMRNCKERTTTEIKGKWDLRTELAKGGLIIFGGVLTLLMTWILTGKL